DRVLAAAQIHVVDALPAAPGDPVVVGRAAHAKALFGSAQDEFLALREVEKLLLGQGCLAGLAVVILGRGMAVAIAVSLLLAILAAPFGCHLEVGVARLGS